MKKFHALTQAKLWEIEAQVKVDYNARKERLWERFDILMSCLARTTRNKA